MIEKKKIMLYITAFILTLSLLCTLTVPTVHAATAPSEKQNELTLRGIQSKSVSAYPALAMTYRGMRIAGNARRINDTLYLPFRALAERVTNAKVTYTAATRTITLTGEGHAVSVSDGAYVLHANGRAFFATTPSVILSDGKMYVPAQILLKALSLTGEQTADGTFSISGTAAPVRQGSLYYREDAVYWLSRIISAESQGEPLLGQIAVGNVIMNRVRSPDFPATIWGVIFDRRYGIQFSPVANGTIYDPPTYTATLAAKICLEGFTLSEDALYFVAPSAASSSWIHNTRRYLFTVRHHEFYT